MLGNRIALEPIAETQTSSGIITGDELNKGFKVGKIIQLGTDIPESHKILKIGDTVTYRGNSAAEMTDWKSSVKYSMIQAGEIVNICLEPVNIITSKPKISTQ